MQTFRKKMIEIRIGTDSDRDDVRSIHLSAFPASERETVSTLAVALLSEDTRPETISLVAETKEAVVGHVAFSPVTLNSNNSYLGYILAPLAVRTEHQKQGTGSQLVEDGIQRLSDMGVHTVFVYGDPKYYGRFGFSVDAAESYDPPYRLQYPFGWQAIALDMAMTEGTSGQIACVAALCDPVLW